jgi:CO dehydrogenase maturation factor
MEAGIEHLARGTSKSVDRLIIVVEPGRRSIETAQTIRSLAADLGLPALAVVGNKIRDEAEKDFITKSLPGFDFLGFIPFDPAVTEADLANRPVFGASTQVSDAIRAIYDKLQEAAKNRT